MKRILAILPICILLLSCAVMKNEENTEQKVLIKTNKGDMVVKLYNETPKHRDNFISLVDSKFYDGLLFHRVIDEFMIQGGDPESKGAKSGKMLGNGGPGYKIDAEIVEGIYHKKGALAAARESDQVNPEKQSSGSQFYIVEGSVWNDDKLKVLIQRRNSRVIGRYIQSYLQDPANVKTKEYADSLRRNRMQAEYQKLYTQLSDAVMPQITADSVKLFELNEDQKQIYSTQGGTPHLDGEYTVFGEVILGLDIVDVITQVEKDKNNRPTEDVVILEMTKLTEKEWKKLEKEMTK